MEDYTLYMEYRVTGTLAVSLGFIGLDNSECSSNLLYRKSLRSQVNSAIPFLFRAIKWTRQEHHVLINLESDMGDWGPLL